MSQVKITGSNKNTKKRYSLSHYGESKDDIGTELAFCTKMLHAVRK